MPIQVPITQKEIDSIGRALRRDQEVVCLDADSYLKTILVAQRRLFRGQAVNACITPMYEGCPQPIFRAKPKE